MQHSNASARAIHASNIPTPTRVEPAARASFLRPSDPHDSNLLSLHSRYYKMMPAPNVGNNEAPRPSKPRHASAVSYTASVVQPRSRFMDPSPGTSSTCANGTEAGDSKSFRLTLMETTRSTQTASPASRRRSSPKVMKRACTGISPTGKRTPWRSQSVQLSRTRERSLVDTRRAAAIPTCSAGSAGPASTRPSVRDQEHRGRTPCEERNTLVGRRRRAPTVEGRREETYAQHNAEEQPPTDTPN